MTPDRLWNHGCVRTMVSLLGSEHGFSTGDCDTDTTVEFDASDSIRGLGEGVSSKVVSIED